MTDIPTIADLISLRGKTVIITGAASGIGAATARRFAEVGAELLLLDLNQEKLNEVEKELSDFDVPIRLYKVDLEQKAEIDAFWDSLGEQSPDVIVNNAGIYPFADFLKTDEDFVRRVMDINLYAVYWMCQHFVRRCLDQKQPGAIVNIASIEAELPFKAHLAHYATAKSAVIAFTRALARDYGDKAIRANVILPGGIMTEGTKGAAKQVLTHPGLIADGIKFRARLPLQRFGQPDEVARIILMLSSEIASYMTGAVVAVDGGFLSA